MSASASRIFSRPRIRDNRRWESTTPAARPVHASARYRCAGAFDSADAIAGRSTGYDASASCSAVVIARHVAAKCSTASRAFSRPTISAATCSTASRAFSRHTISSAKCSTASHAFFRPTISAATFSTASRAFSRPATSSAKPPTLCLDRDRRAIQAKPAMFRFTAFKCD